MHTRTVEQAALVPAPGGPQAAGPLVESSHIAFEGGMAFSRTESSANARSPSQNGHIVLDAVAHGRVAYGVSDRVELGLGAEYGRRSWADPLASDLTAADLADEVMWRVGPQLRGIFAGDRTGGFGGLFEVAVSSLPYQRVVHERVIEGTFAQDTWEVVDSQELSRSLSRKMDAATFWNVRAGLFGTVSVVEWVNLTGGALVQNHPLFFGSRQADGRCEYWDDTNTTRCEGVVNVDHVDPYESNMLITIFASVGAELGPFAVIGQVHAHTVGNREIVGPSPVGGDVVVRVAF